MMMSTAWFNLEISIQLIYAALLGAILGIQRGRRASPAGLRTHLLVALGAAAFMELSRWMPDAIPAVFGNTPRQSDPARMAAQVISGIGFLGAGAIIRDGLTIKGLTTAATLWVAAAIGMSAGAGFYVMGLSITIIALVALTGAEYIDKSKKQERVLSIRIPTHVSTDQVKEVIARENLSVLRYDYQLDMVKETIEVRLIVTPPANYLYGDRKGEDLAKAFKESGIQLISLEWSHRYN